MEKLLPWLLNCIETLCCSAILLSMQCTLLSKLNASHCVTMLFCFGLNKYSSIAHADMFSTSKSLSLLVATAVPKQCNRLPLELIYKSPPLEGGAPPAFCNCPITCRMSDRLTQFVPKVQVLVTASTYCKYNSFPLPLVVYINLTYLKTYAFTPLPVVVGNE